MKVDLLIQDAVLVTHSGMCKAELAVSGEKIAGIVEPDSGIQAEEVISAKGKYLLPGIIDSHVHFNEPGREEWEGFSSGSRSAAAGGITTILDMPLNSNPCTITAKELQRKIEAGERHSLIDFGLWGGATPENLEHLDELHAGGVAAFKAFLSYSGIEEFGNIPDGHFMEILSRLGTFGNMIGLHAESDALTNFLADKLQKEGRLDRKAFLESRPPFSEEEAVKRLLFLAEQLPDAAAIHVVHVSLASNIHSIQQARAAGLRVTAETCPHYLTLSGDDFERLGPVAKCAPPLRSAEEIEALWDCIRKGLVDTIGSDHSPCPTEAKARGNDNVWQAWGGISGLQTMLPVLFSEGVVKRKIAFSKLVRMMTYTPAKLFGLLPQKGTLLPGTDADFVIFDPQKTWTLQQGDLFYKHPHSPYIGKEMTGSVDMTFARGHCIYRHGEIVASEALGKFLKRQDAHVS